MSEGAAYPNGMGAISHVKPKAVRLNHRLSGTAEYQINSILFLVIATLGYFGVLA